MTESLEVETACRTGLARVQCSTSTPIIPSLPRVSFAASIPLQPGLHTIGRNKPLAPAAFNHPCKRNIYSGQRRYPNLSLESLALRQLRQKTWHVLNRTSASPKRNPDRSGFGSRLGSFPKVISLEDPHHTSLPDRLPANMHDPTTTRFKESSNPLPLSLPAKRGWGAFSKRSPPSLRRC